MLSVKSVFNTRLKKILFVQNGVRMDELWALCMNIYQKSTFLECISKFNCFARPVIDRECHGGSAGRINNLILYVPAHIEWQRYENWVKMEVYHNYD